MGRYLVIAALLVIAGVASAHESFEFLHRLEFEDAKERIVASRELPGGELLVVGKATIRVWDIATGRLIRSVQNDLESVKKWDAAVMISPDGRRAVVLDSFSFRFVRKEKKVSAAAVDLETGKLLAVLERPVESVRDAEWSPDGKTLATYSGRYNQKRTEVCFWNGETFELKSCTVMKGSLGLARLIDEGRHFVYSRQTDTTCILCPLTAVTETAVLETGNARRVHAFSADGESPFIWSRWNSTDPEGNYLAANLKGGKLAVWNMVRKGDPIFTVEPGKKDRYLQIMAFADGGSTLFVKKNNDVVAHDLESGEVLYSFPLAFRSKRSGHMYTVRASGDRLVVDNCEQALVFAPPSPQPLFSLDLVCKTEFDPVSTSYRDFDVLRFDEDQRALLISSDKQIRVADGTTGELLQRIAAPERLPNIEKDPNKDDGLTGAKWSKHVAYIIASGADGRSFYIYRRITAPTQVENN